MLTGKEELAMPEETPACTKLGKSLLQLALTACGGQARAAVKADSLLESPEIDVAWHELGFRMEQMGEDWPNGLIVKLPTTAMDWRLTEWGKAPGSPESQAGMAQTLTDFEGCFCRSRGKLAVCSWSVMQEGTGLC